MTSVLSSLTATVIKLIKVDCWSEEESHGVISEYIGRKKSIMVSTSICWSKEDSRPLGLKK